jgi:hypothetical protein
VLRSIERLKHHPNLHASSLAGSKSRTWRHGVESGEPVFLQYLQDDAHAKGLRSRDGAQGLSR